MCEFHFDPNRAFSILPSYNSNNIRIKTNLANINSLKSIVVSEIEDIFVKIKICSLY